MTRVTIGEQVEPASRMNGAADAVQAPSPRRRRLRRPNTRRSAGQAIESRPSEESNHCGHRRQLRQRHPLRTPPAAVTLNRLEMRSDDSEPHQTLVRAGDARSRRQQSPRSGTTVFGPSDTLYAGPKFSAGAPSASVLPSPPSHWLTTSAPTAVDMSL